MGLVVAGRPHDWPRSLGVLLLGPRHLWRCCLAAADRPALPRRPWQVAAPGAAARPRSVPLPADARPGVYPRLYPPLDLWLWLHRPCLREAAAVRRSRRPRPAPPRAGLHGPAVSPSATPIWRPVGGQAVVAAGAVHGAREDHHVGVDGVRGGVGPGAAEQHDLADESRHHEAHDPRGAG